MLIFNLCEILATLNFSQSEENIREGSIKYSLEQLSFAYTNKAAAVHKILVIHFLIIITVLLNLFSMYTLNSPWFYLPETR